MPRVWRAHLKFYKGIGLLSGGRDSRRKMGVAFKVLKFLV